MFKEYKLSVIKEIVTHVAKKSKELIAINKEISLQLDNYLVPAKDIDLLVHYKA